MLRPRRLAGQAQAFNTGVWGARTSYSRRVAARARARQAAERAVTRWAVDITQEVSAVAKWHAGAGSCKPDRVYPPTSLTSACLEEYERLKVASGIN